MNILVTNEMLPLLTLKVFGHSVLTQNILYHHRLKNVSDFVISAPSACHDVLRGLVGSLTKTITINFAENADAETIPATKLCIHDSLFVNITTPADLKIYRQKFKQNILENTQTPVARYLNKPLSIPISHVLARLKISPNLISYAALLVSLLGAWLTILNPLGVAGYLCFHINSLLDGCDGEVARMNYAFSEFGKKLDVFGDYFTTILILISVAFGFKTLAGWMSLVFFTLTILLWAGATIFKLTPKNLAEIESQCHKKLAQPESLWEKTLAVMLFVSRRDLYILSLFVMSILGLAELIPLWLASLSFSWLALSLYTLKFLINSLAKSRV